MLIDLVYKMFQKSYTILHSFLMSLRNGMLSVLAWWRAFLGDALAWVACLHSGVLEWVVWVSCLRGCMGGVLACVAWVAC